MNNLCQKVCSTGRQTRSKKNQRQVLTIGRHNQGSAMTSHTAHSLSVAFVVSVFFDVPADGGFAAARPPPPLLLLLPLTSPEFVPLSDPASSSWSNDGSASKGKLPFNKKIVA